jgi:hypothetical protein
MSSAIQIRQTNPVDKANLHEVTNWVIPTLPATGHLQEQALTTKIRDLLFEMRKDGEIYWVGAAVPEGVSDFTKVQVFFHPTIFQKPVWRAKEEDYPAFTGGWRENLQPYVARQGGQLAGARRMPLVVPFMTMASYSGKAPAYMFATRSIETLNVIIAAVREAATGQSGPLAVQEIGVSSFSAGIAGMRLFIQTFGSSRLIKETTDFDGPWIKGSPQTVTTSPGAKGRVFTQRPFPHDTPDPRWIKLDAWRFQNITHFRERGVHAQIGWMTFFVAAKSSVIK